MNEIVVYRNFGMTPTEADVEAVLDDAADDARALAYPSRDLDDVVSIRVIGTRPEWDATPAWVAVFTFSTREATPGVQAARRRRQ